MQNPMKKLTLPNLQVLIAALVWTILLVMPAQLAHAYQVPTTAAGTWTLVGGVAQKTTPSGGIGDRFFCLRYFCRVKFFARPKYELWNKIKNVARTTFFLFLDVESRLLLEFA